MNLPEIVSSGKNKGAKEKKTPLRVPWQIGGGGDTDDWRPSRCRPTSMEQAKHKYEGLVRARDEARKADVAKKILRDRVRRKPIITYPSEDELVRRVESPFAVMESDLLESYYCRPPKVSPSLMELLDKYYEPINRDFHPSYLDLPAVEAEQVVQHTETTQSILKTRREKREKRNIKSKKEEISNLIRTRIKGLKRLRDGYINTENKYKCHFTERKNAKVKEKKEYIESLAQKYNCSVGLLESRTDSLYEKYIESQREKTQSERQYIEGTLEWMERLLQEERKKEILEKPPKRFVYRKKIQPPVVEEFITLPPPTLFPILEEEEEVMESEAEGEGKSSERKQNRRKSKKSIRRSSRKSSRRSSRKSSRRSSRRASRKSSTRASSKSSRRASKKSSRRASRRASRKGSKTKSEGQLSKHEGSKKSVSKSSKKKLSTLEPYKETEPLSVLDPELVGMFRQWEEKHMEVERLKIKGPGLPPNDPAYIAKPPLILINNFLPNVVYTRKVKLVNRNNRRAYCRPHLIKIQPDDDLGVLKVEPWKVLSSPPGIYPSVNVIFSPVETTGRIEADIIFLSRHPPKSWKSFSFHVTCIPPTPQISVEPILFKFPAMKIWSQEVLTTNFTITNKGAVACMLFIRKKDEFYQCSNCEELEIYEEEYEDVNQIKFDSLFCIYPSVKFLGLKDKKNAKPKRRQLVKHEDSVIEDESAEVVYSIMEELFNTVFETFTVDRKYDIEIPGRSRLRVSLAFKPRFAPNLGTAHEEWCLMFTDFWDFCQTQVINIVAQIESTPLYVKPLVLDMKLCLLENGVQQESFIVGNKGRRGHQLVVTIPPEMSNQAVIHNPGPLVLGGEELKILVRLDLKYSFCAESTEFYDPATNILDFPVYVSSKDENETGPPLTVRVMAIVSRSMGLQVIPALIDYGVVYTYQSAVAPFYLANHSLATHKFAFLNLPKWVMIQPGYGFGAIGAGEKLRLDLIYSPTEEQVAWPGGSSEHFFILIATTIDRLANHQPVHKLISVDHRHEQQFPEDYDVKDEDYPPPEAELKEQDVPEPKTARPKGSISSKKFGGKKSTVGVGSKTPGAKKKQPKKPSSVPDISEPMNQDPLDFTFIMPDFDELLELYKRKSIFGDELLPYGAENKTSRKLSITMPAEGKVNALMMDDNMVPQYKVPTDEPQDEVGILPICTSPDPVFTYLAVRAVVIDPHCELSAQRIVLPPTPFYSYTITPFYLRCLNLQTYKICYCGKDINNSYGEPPKVRARYEFFSKLPFLDVEPSSGQISTGQNLKINIIVRPRLDQNEIVEQAKILKAIAERERLIRERKKHRDRDRVSKKSSRRESQRSSRRSSKRASRRSSQRDSRKSSAKRKSTASSSQRKSLKRKSVAKRQSAAPGKRKSAVGQRKSAIGKRQSSAGKRQSKQRKSMNGKRSGSKKVSKLSEHEEKEIVVNPQDMVVDEADLFNAKLHLMRYKEPEKFNTKVVCYIETELENPPYTKRKEELELNIYGTLVRPDIVVFTPPNLDQHIKFETTAVGQKRTLFFQVYNTSGGTVLLNHSFFDAPETYNIPLRLPLDQHRPNDYLKTGMWLEPDHHVNFPIVFAPKKEKTISEFIEIRGNKTIVPVKVLGRGVEPKFRITPEFIVGKLRSNLGNPAKLSFLIENQCDAELEFDFLKLYTKEGPIYPLDQEKAARTSGKSKKRAKGGRKSLSPTKSVSRKSVSRKSVARKSKVSRKSVSRKSVSSRKSLSRKSVTGGKGKNKNSEADMAVEKGEIKDAGRKNLAAAGKNKPKMSFAAKNYDEVLKGELIHSLKNEFTPVSTEKQEYLYSIPTKTMIKPHTSHKYEVVFRPFKAKNPEDEVMLRSPKRKSEGGSSKSRKSSRKSTERKSVARKSKVARKSVARKSVARKSKVARKSVSKKSIAGGRKSMSGSKKKISRGGKGSKKGPSKKIEYIIEEEMFKKTYVSKVRLMLGAFTKVLDWWFLGQVFEKVDSRRSTNAKQATRKKK